MILLQLQHLFNVYEPGNSEYLEEFPLGFYWSSIRAPVAQLAQFALLEIGELGVGGPIPVYSCDQLSVGFNPYGTVVLSVGFNPYGTVVPLYIHRPSRAPR